VGDCPLSRGQPNVRPTTCGRVRLRTLAGFRIHRRYADRFHRWIAPTQTATWRLINWPTRSSHRDFRRDEGARQRVVTDSGRNQLAGEIVAAADDGCGSVDAARFLGLEHSVARSIPGGEVVPQDVVFNIPFQERYNPDNAAAEQHNLGWLRQHKMLVDPAAVTMYTSWGMADLAARCWPDATVDDLGLSVDLKSFYFLFDDQFDGPHGTDPAQVAAVCQQLIDIVHHIPGVVPRSPVTTAFADLWARSCVGMSAHWIARTAYDWERYFASYSYEAINRRSHMIPTMDYYLAVRRGSAATESVIDMVERLNRIEVPPIAFHSAPLRLMRQVAADVPFFCNDVYSYEKEAARGDVYNMIAVFCNERQYSVRAATEEIQRLVARQVDQFCCLRDQVPQMVKDLALPEQQRRCVRRYVSGLEDWLRGHNDWMTRTIRYRTTGTPPPSQPGYIDELLEPRGHCAAPLDATADQQSVSP